MEQLTGQALLIVGSPRSGTSAIANAFRLLGFYLGEPGDFPEAKEGNPMGIFERHEILEFNGKCADELYLRHDRPDFDAMSEHPAFPRLVDQASTLLRRLFVGHDFWGWKEPQTTILAPIYQAALRRDGVPPGYLICVRRPAEVFKSQEKIMETATGNREAPLGVRAYRRWIAYTLKSLTYSTGGRRAVVAYHDLVRDPRSLLEGAFWGVTGGERPQPAALETACQSIQPSLHRNRVEADVPPDAPQIVHDLWKLCCVASLSPQELCRGGFDDQIAEIDSQYRLLSTCFGEPEPPHCSVLFYLNEDRKVFSSPVLPTGQWNQVEMEIPVGPASTLMGMLYPMPAQVYIRNANWATGAAKVRPAGETVESAEGDATRFSVVSAPPQVTLRTPSEMGPHRLSMEVFVEMNPFLVADASARQSHVIRNMESHIEALHQHAATMEQEIHRLRKEQGMPPAKP